MIPQLVRHLSAGPAPLPQPEGQAKILPRGRSYAPVDPAKAGQHKLSAPWEGPFVISRGLGNDSYYLINVQKPKARKRDDSGKESERPWNANLLRRFYS